MSNVLVILAGGNSSRMKKSAAQLTNHPLTNYAQSLHKSLIPLGASQTPLLSRLCLEAHQAGINHLVIVTSPENQSFYQWRSLFLSTQAIKGLKIDFAVQYPSTESEKPMGTADAILQAMEQYPTLRKQRFVIANGDNLYSAKAIETALNHRNTDHALVNYDSKGLGFDAQRVSAFALVHVDRNNHVLDIVEKPELETLASFTDHNGAIRVSMNLCSVSGEHFYHALKECPVHPVRGEKELPEAFRIAIKHSPSCVYSYLISESLPDLTSAADLDLF